MNKELPKSSATQPIDSVPRPSKLEARVDLKEMFPLSIRVAFRESFLYLLGLAFVVAGYIAIALQLSHVATLPEMAQSTEFALRSALYVAITVCGGKLLYEILCFWVYRYTIELEHLTITRGILFRSRASFPLARINDVSLTREPLDILFGIYTLTILTASPTSEYGSIDGLPSRSAHGLQAYLLALVETTLPDVREEVAESIVERSALQKQA